MTKIILVNNNRMSDIDLLVPKLKERIKMLLVLLQEHNIPGKIFETLRSEQRQKELVEKGTSKTLKSKHLEGNAVDIVMNINGKWSWAPEHIYLYEIMGVLAEKIGGLIWGGNWKWKDWCHIELKEAKNV